MRLSSCETDVTVVVGGQDDLVGRCGQRRVLNGVLGGLGGGGVLFAEFLERALRLDERIARGVLLASSLFLLPRRLGIAV